MSTNSYKFSSQPDGPIIEEEIKHITGSKALIETDPQGKDISYLY
jgi:hypothetical protein